MKVPDRSGYSAKPLATKLGLTFHMRVCLKNTPPSYPDWIGPVYPELQTGVAAPWDFVHFFTNHVRELEEYLPIFRDQIHPSGMIWVSWYKKSSGLPGELSEDIIRDTALALHLVDVKVCSVSAEWSALKLVIPRHLRQN